MIHLLFQIPAIVAVAYYLFCWRASARRRSMQSWDSLVARLRPDWNTRELKQSCLSDEGASASPEEKWARMHGAAGLWALYENARVMLEMADYAARNSDTVDRELLENLRTDALQIRVSVLTALARYAFSQVNEGICVNALRAASAYTEMAARMTEFVQAGAPGPLPDFVAAM
jgi:hypothetical protein